MLFSYSSKAIMTKALSMYGKRITESQYAELLHKKSVAEIAAYLRDETGYAKALAGIQPTSIHRGQLEMMLRKHRFTRYSRLIHYDPDKKSGYYRYLIVEFEIQQILQMVQLLNSGREEEYLAQYPLFLQQSAQFDMMALARVRSFDDLMQVLANTPYYHLILECRPVGSGEIDYTRCEVNLMTYYYRHVEDLIDADFTGSTRSRLHELFQTRLELQNIGTLFRIKRYFPDMPAEEVRRCLLPVWKRIPDRELDRLISTASADDFLMELSQSPYRRLIGPEDFVFVEYTANKIEYHIARKYLRFATDAPTAFTAYMALSSMELKNITMIIEGVRYGIPPAEIRKMLIL